MADKKTVQGLNIQTPKGRSMLQWVGKQPPGFVQGYPVQLVEAYNPSPENEILKVPAFEQLEKNWQNLLFHGDNKEVLASLLELGFRGKVDLIYIDPPFASNKDYVRKVELRGLKDLGRLEEDSESLIQQTMYEDIWKRDEYFQFMYERLILLKELLAETGSIYVHLDYRMVHYIKILMDEVFGDENFSNQIIWSYQRWTAISGKYQSMHDTILFYSKKNDERIFNTPRIEPSDSVKKRMERGWDQNVVPIDGKRLPQLLVYNQEKVNQSVKKGKLDLSKFARIIDRTETTKPLSDVFLDISYINSQAKERTAYSTQKPEALLERIIRTSSNSADLVLDCFMGSGTTCAVSQKLGRRWIGVDINKGAIQVTSKRLQQIMLVQQNDLLNNHTSKAFGVYRVNNYDLRILKSEAKELAVQQYGITRTRADAFFDGVRDNGELVRIVDFNHPLTLLDLQLIKDELSKRPVEDRDIVVICLGRESKVDAWVEGWNKKQPYKDTRVSKRMRQFLVFDLKDKNFVSYEPSQADVEIKRVSANKVNIQINAFISPTIIKRLAIEPGLLQKKIPDFRSMIDVILVDTDYDGEVFNINYSDLPEKKASFIKGTYELQIKEKTVNVAVKIIDMLGEEVLITQEI